MREKRQILTNRQMAKAFGGYDFMTEDMKQVCIAQKNLTTSLFREEISKLKPLSDEEIRKANPQECVCGITDARAMCQAQLTKSKEDLLEIVEGK